MSDSGQSQRRARTREADEVEAPETTETTADELLEDVDELLDEIDEVLEENAEEFIKNYVQKGGQ
ncbi:MAG TPA: ubiquitin-like protein Pup [Nitriliruptorales bacterium]|nr:ubiquitin-like protein Pup [Nitriliruptorales bacterium]